MENPTPFDLEKNIKEWKGILSRKGMNNENIMELESHLLDEIENLKSKGLNEEESYFVAQKRLGTIEKLTEEYKKVETEFISLDRIMPVLKGILLYFAFIFGVENLSNLSVVLGSYLNINESTLIVSNIVLLSLVGIATLGFSYLFVRHKNWNFHIFGSIPVLALSVILLKIFYVLSVPLITYEVKATTFGLMRVNFAYFQIAIIGLIIVVSYILYLKNKKFKAGIEAHAAPN